MTQSFLASHFFDIKPSPRLRLAMAFFHLLAMLASILNALPAQFQAISVAVVAILWWMNNRYWKPPALLVRYTESNGWEIAIDGMDYVGGQVLADTVITRWGIFLRFKTDRQATMSLLIANDALTADDFRRLRVNLALLGRGRN
ncbi:protein YgfX [Methylomonas methanica]|uniref:Toxin CptA n=1 Tax=Methylomonas methanica (strain DSM 25384 / MC09) TaxID=857087 RepID=G0A4C0_METMM|nr:protein YgfX [Methylomonas methanica]AEG00336.1 hypothetical protein Metme_1920 [Methylomonas methanica MC09]